MKQKFANFYDFAIDDVLSNINEEQFEEISDISCVYVQYCSDLSRFYIGESDRYFQTLDKSRDISKRCTGRFEEHLKEPETQKGNILHNKFDRVLIITSKYLKGNAKILESLLLKNIFVEFLTIRNRKLTNKIINQDHTENISTEIDYKVFPDVWDKLKKMKIVKSDLDSLKYSMYNHFCPFGKDFDKKEIQSIDKIVQFSEDSKEIQRLLIKGEPGTGKTFITFLSCLEMIDRGKKIAIIINQVSIKKLYEKLFYVFPKSEKPFIGSLASFFNKTKNGTLKIEDLSLIIVDEAHRLKQPEGKQQMFPSVFVLDKNKTNYTELDILEKYPVPIILMYDSFQLIRDSDIDVKKFEEKVKKYEVIQLEKQYRIKSDSNIDASHYTKGIRNVLQLTDEDFDLSIFSNGYNFKIVDNLPELQNYISTKIDASYKHSRLISGYYKEWTSRKDNEKFEWDEAVYGVNLRWNTPNSELKEKENWLEYTAENDLESTEVGCVHVVQGMDLDFAGVIIGNDLEIVDGKLKANKEHYFDSSGKPISGTDVSGERLTEHIKRIYYILLTRGIRGTAVYFENQDVRTYFEEKLGIEEKQVQ